MITCVKHSQKNIKKVFKKQQNQNKKAEKKTEKQKKTTIKNFFFSINNKLKTFLHVMVLQGYKYRNRSHNRKWVNVLQSGAS